MSFATKSEQRILLTWRAPASRRLIVAACAGGAAALVSGLASAPWQLTVLAGWNTAATAFLALVWFTISRFSAPQTAAMATLEDNSRRGSGVVLLASATASLVGLAFGLHRANQSHGQLRFWLTVAVISGIVLSWAVVHTVYVLRYAHLYYTGPDMGPDIGPDTGPDAGPETGPDTGTGTGTDSGLGTRVGSSAEAAPGSVASPRRDGIHAVSTRHGVTFPGGDEPDYLDFAYLSFTLGMTFQVSDNTVLSRPLRRTVLIHCLMSYLFGTVIIATSINVLAGLV